MMIFKILCITLLLNLGLTLESQCPVDVPEQERRECYKWDNPTRDKCQAKGCVWCETNTPNIPFCFHNDGVCPSTIPENERQDCFPEPGADREKCNSRGCIWCKGSTSSVPSCFRDERVSQGGKVCPNDIPENDRIDCHPEPNATPSRCIARGCFWCEGKSLSAPACFTPKQHGYRIIGQPIETPKGLTVQLQRINRPTWFSKPVDNLQMNFEFQENDRLRIKIFDPNNNRFEVPLNIESSTKAPNPLYEVLFSTDNVFSFKVIRKQTGEAIWDTSLNGLTFEDQFLQIVTKLSTEKIYGFGEHEHHTLKHPTNWFELGMWSRDVAVNASRNLYGVHPYYINLEKSKSAHGVLLKNANAQDVTISPSPALTYRTIGGIIDIYIFLGPTMENVQQQYMKAIGNPVMVPYWALGFQLCRWGYRDLKHLSDAVDRMRKYDIPHDIQYGDIDYMDGERDFTIDPVNFAGLPEYVNKLKAEGTRFVIILDPAIKMDDPPGSYLPFERGLAKDVYVKKADGITNIEGEVWPGRTYFPDFHSRNTTDWWIDECKRFKEKLDYAGIWIDMNEPANFVHGSPDGCVNDEYTFPPYVPKILDNMYQKTLCLDSKDSLGRQYDTHSLYGWSQVEPTYIAARQVTGKRSIVFSRSTFPGAGKFGQHWLGDNWSDWSNLRWSIIGMIEFNWFGFPYVGADICGFIDDATEELCQRWQQLGAFYPYSRNHNGRDNKDQDPGIWPEVAKVTRETLHIRYTLLPYLYTLFHKAHKDGASVVRSLMHEFTNDDATHEIIDQFLWGSSFLISPVLDENKVSIKAYIPDARWYSYYDGKELPVRRGETELSAPLDFIPLHVRGGYILPTQQPANSTVFSRENPMGLIVALDDDFKAVGNLFWDDGESQDTYENGIYFYSNYQVTSENTTRTLKNEIVKNAYDDANRRSFNSVRILGEELSINEITVNGVSINPNNWEQDETTKQIIINSLDLSLTNEFTIIWK